MRKDKKIAALILVIALSLNFCACGEATTISMYDLQKTMLAADPAVPEMRIASSSDSDAEKKFSYLSNMDYGKVSSYFLAYAADGMAYEIAVICLKNQGDVSEAEESLRTHLEGRVNLYKAYEPTQTMRAENALIASRHHYVTLIMCDDTASVKAAFENSVGN